MSEQRYKIGVWMQEYVSAQRNIIGITKDIEAGKLPPYHPALLQQLKRLKKAKEELAKLGIEVKN